MTEYIYAHPQTEEKATVKTEAKKAAAKEEGLSSEAPLIKEVKFFSDPKAVKKKTEGGIIVFQIVFTALFCLAYKLSELVAPELYSNISAYLERLFRW